MNYKTETRNIDVFEISNVKNIWTQEEHHKMYLYMEEHRQDIIEHIQNNIDHETRINKSNFFVQMSKFIGTKSDRQCKSRYQKKEGVLLKALELPEKLIEKYIKAKKAKAKVHNWKKRVSIQSTQVCNSIVKQDELSFASIVTFSDLKAMILNDCLPKVQNQTVKNYLEAFIHNLPLDDETIGDIPSFDLHSLIQIQPRMGFSSELIQDPDMIYFEDYE